MISRLSITRRHRSQTRRKQQIKERFEVFDHAVQRDARLLNSGIQHGLLCSCLLRAIAQLLLPLRHLGLLLSRETIRRAEFAEPIGGVAHRVTLIAARLSPRIRRDTSVLNIAPKLIVSRTAVLDRLHHIGIRIPDLLKLIPITCRQVLIHLLKDRRIRRGSRRAGQIIERSREGFRIVLDCGRFLRQPRHHNSETRNGETHTGRDAQQLELPPHTVSGNPERVQVPLQIGDRRQHTPERAHSEKGRARDTRTGTQRALNRVGQLLETVDQVRHHIRSIREGGGDSAAHVDAKIDQGVTHHSDAGLGSLVPVRGLLSERDVLAIRFVAHLHSAREQGHAIRALLRRGRQAQQRVRLADTGDAQFRQDTVSRHALRLDVPQPRNERVQRLSGVVLPRGSELLSGHARDLSEQIELVAALVCGLPDALHRERHRGTASLSLNTDRRHRGRNAHHVTLGEAGLRARARETHRQRHNLRLSGREVVAQPHHGRAEPVHVALRGAHDVHEPGERSSRLLGGHIRGLAQINHRPGEVFDVRHSDAQLARRLRNRSNLLVRGGKLLRHIPQPGLKRRHLLVSAVNSLRDTSPRRLPINRGLGREAGRGEHSRTETHRRI